MGLIIIPSALTDDAALTSTPAAVAGLGPDNLKLSDRGLIWRVLGDTASVSVELPAIRRIGGIVLWRHTLTSQATWRVRIWSGAAQTGEQTYDSGVVQAVPPKALGDLDWGIDPLGASIDGQDFSPLILPGNVVARSMLIDITDTGAAQINVGRLFAGEAVAPEVTFGWGSSVTWERNRRATRTASGGLRVESDPPYRVLRIELAHITPDERRIFADLLRDTGNAREAWISARHGEGGRFESDHALLGYLVDNPALTREQGVRYTLPIQIEES
ncbi:MAG: hypothetical protein U1C54_09730 [Xanthomonadaceae bacterium]|nr:hypothetical protein [Xanthomonadaceae bacterium]